MLRSFGRLKISVVARVSSLSTLFIPLFTLGIGLGPTDAGAMAVDPDAANREFVSQNMDSDLQFILGDSGVSVENQAAIARRYRSLRKFSPLGDDRASIRTACLQDFAIPQDTAAVVSSSKIAKEFLAKEVELRAEAKVLGQPRILQIHERQAMLKAVEAVYGILMDFGRIGMPCT